MFRKMNASHRCQDPISRYSYGNPLFQLFFRIILQFLFFYKDFYGLLNNAFQSFISLLDADSANLMDMRSQVSSVSL